MVLSKPKRKIVEVGDEITEIIYYDNLIRVSLNFEKHEVEVTKKMVGGDDWGEPLKLSMIDRQGMRIFREQMYEQMAELKKKISSETLNELGRLGVSVSPDVKESVESQENIESSSPKPKRLG